MWTWLKNFFGIKNKEDVLVNPVVVIDNKDKVVNTVVITEQVEIFQESKKTSPAVIDDVIAIPSTLPAADLNGMKKNELLALAKEKGLKANASMNKQALIDLLNG